MHQLVFTEPGPKPVFGMDCRLHQINSRPVFTTRVSAMHVHVNVNA